MHEASLPKVQTHVGHLALDTKEQYVPGPKLTAADGTCRRPKLASGAWDLQSGLPVGILHCYMLVCDIQVGCV